MKRKLAAIAILGLIAGCVWYFVGRNLTLEELARQESRLRELISEQPLLALATGFVAYSVMSLFPGMAGKSLVIGWLFGLWPGVVLVNFGLTAAAVASFLLGRSLFRDMLQSRFPVRLRRLDEAIARDGAFYLFALRMMHAPYSLTNYAMGATCISTKQFWWSTQLGMLPGNFVFVYAGTQIPTLSEAAAHGLAGVVSVHLLAALALLGLLPLIARWVMAQFFSKTHNAIE